MEELLIVVDMQNDFVSGSLGTLEAQNIISNVVSRINEYQKLFDNKKINIYATRDTHYGEDFPIIEKRYSNTQEGKSLPIAHCIKNTEGWEIHKEVKNALNGRCVLMNKETFASVELAKDILCRFPNGNVKIELIGLCTDICVISNALLIKAFIPEAKIIVNSSCCAGVTVEKHLAALEIFKSCNIEVI